MVMVVPNPSLDSSERHSFFESSKEVVENIARKYGVSKSDLMDREADDLVVRIALGETQVISETKNAFKKAGVNVESFEELTKGKVEGVKRSNHVLLAKNLPYGSTESELSIMFGKFGSLDKIILPSTKTLALARSLFVKNLNFKTTDESLRQHFSEHMKEGHISSVKVKKHLKNGKNVSMGFGFVEFDSTETATSVRSNLQGTVLDSHALNLQPCHVKDGGKVLKKVEKDKSSTKYDLEAWFPASQTYRELVSCSNCTDYQARKLEIRFGHKKGSEAGKKKYVHLLNSTLTATERTICCILENNQKEDGVEIPEVLRPFMGGKTFLPFKNKPNNEAKGKKSKA